MFIDKPEIWALKIEIYLKWNCNIHTGALIMEELTLLGVIYVVVGVFLALFTVITLVLTIVGLLLVLMGIRPGSRRFGSYPMFMPCPNCGEQMEAGGQCMVCEQPTIS